MTKAQITSCAKNNWAGYWMYFGEASTRQKLGWYDENLSTDRRAEIIATHLRRGESIHLTWMDPNNLPGDVEELVDDIVEQLADVHGLYDEDYREGSDGKDGYIFEPRSLTA